MLGDALKQLGQGLVQYVRYHLRKLFWYTASASGQMHPPPTQASPAPAARVIQAIPESLEPTDFANLDDHIDLDQRFRSTVHWPSYRSDVPSAAILKDELYQLWLTTSGGYKWLHYFEAYQAVFGPLRTKPLRVLEIGVYRGSSLLLWRRYFAHPDSVIVGIDINPNCSQFNAPAAGIYVRTGSQIDGAFLRSVVQDFGPFDLIIDDGSHLSSHMITSFNHLYLDGLAENGIYFVEDLHTNYWPQWRDSRKSFLDVCKDLVEYMHAHYQCAPATSFTTKGPTEQPMEGLNVPLIATLIKEVRVFDSMVAIYKTRRDYIPYCVSGPG